ncbi:MAG: Ni/Fe-hydrogenase, b-type cytochrome subunit [Acidobacteriaceae bacterium]
MATLTNAPNPELSRAAKSEVVPVYVWQLPVRLAHWTMVLSLTVLTVTGFYMHHPFLVATSPSAWVMGTMRFVHELFGFILIAVLIVRFYWFFAGNQWAHWRAWLPLKREQWRSISGMVLFYAFRRKEPFPEVGHNSLASASYLGILFFLVVECVTGLVLYSVVLGNHLLTLLVGWIPRVVDIQYIRATHYFLMFVFIAFLIHHVYSAVVVSMEERNGLMESIFSGWKFVPRILLEKELKHPKGMKVQKQGGRSTSARQGKP